MILTFGLSANYKNALTYYKSGLYKQAIMEAKSSKKSYSNPNLHLIWGASAQKLGKLNEAMSAYERVLLLDPSNSQAQKALDGIYTKTKRYKLLKDKNPSRNSANWNTTISLAFGFDNNLDATPDSETLQEYFGDTIDSNKTSSSFARLTGSLSYTNDFDEKGGWSVKYLLKAYAQNNFQNNFYNLQTFSFETGLGYNNSNYNFYLPVSYHRVNYLNKDLLSQYRINPKLLIPIEKSNILDFNLIYSQNKYINKEDFNKNDTTYAVEIGNYFLSEKDYFSIHMKYEHHSAINLLPSKYIGANFWTLKLGAKYLLNPKWLTEVNYRFRYGQYDDLVGTSITTRDDNFHQLDTKLSYQWRETSHLFIADTYTENKSNYPAAVYQKNILLLGIDVSF